MFLNKHSSQLNKPKNTQTAKPKRILGGKRDPTQAGKTNSKHHLNSNSLP